MDTQLKEFFVNFFVPIDNIPEDTAWRNSISMEARASMLIDNASLEELSSLFNVCINEGYLYLFKDKLRYGWQKKEPRSIYSYEQYWRRTC